MKSNPVTMTPHDFKSALQQNSQNIIDYVEYLARPPSKQDFIDSSSSIFKIASQYFQSAKKVDKLSGLAEFIMGVIFSGHLHIYEEFNGTIFITLVDYYHEIISSKPIMNPTSSSQKNYAHYNSNWKNKKSLSDIQIYKLQLTQEILYLMAKWLPYDFSMPQKESVYLKTFNNICCLKQQRVKNVIYNSKYLKKIEKKIDNMNLDNKRICHLCIQISNKFLKQKKLDNKQIQNQKVNSALLARIIKNSKKQIKSNLLISDSAREIQSHERLKSPKLNIKYKQRKAWKQQMEQKQNQKNSQNLNLLTIDKQIPTMTVFSSSTDVNSQSFSSLESQSSNIDFRRELGKRAHHSKLINFTSIKELKGFGYKIHKGIIKIVYPKQQNATIISPDKKNIIKHNKSDGYFLIDFTQNFGTSKIIVKFDQQDHISIPVGLIKMIEQCKIEEWELDKTKLSETIFLLDQGICSSIEVMADRLGLKQQKKRYQNFIEYVLMGTLIKNKFKISISMLEKKILVQGWCSPEIAESGLMGRLFEQIKYCYSTKK